MAPNTAKTCRIVIEKVETNPPWVIARLPFDPKQAWPAWSNRRVRGTLNGYAFKTSLLKSKAHGSYFVVFKKMLKEAGAQAGDRVEVRIEPDLEGHNYAEPKELTAVLRQDKSLRKSFDAMPPSVRRWFCMGVDEAKRAETRKERAERVAEMVMQVMEGEEIPPPILRAAFQRQPSAEQGWRASTKAQRRTYLLGISMSQGVEARQRRVDDVIDKCLEAAKRKNGRARIDEAGRQFE